MRAGKLAAWLAVALVFGQSQAFWCVATRCVASQWAMEQTSHLPPCHRSHSDSGKSTPSSHSVPSSKDAPTNACSHDVEATALVKSQGLVMPQFGAAFPILAVLPVQIDANFGFLSTARTSALLMPVPPGSSGPVSSVLRI
jgi:hypothetical protein